MVQNVRPGAASALLELTRTAGEAAWDTSIRHIVQFDAESLPVERVSFWSLSEEGSSIRCDSAYTASDRAFERGAVLYRSDHPEYFEAIGQANILVIEKVESDPRTRGMRNYFAPRGISSMLDVPIWVDGRLGGVLCHEHIGEPKQWTIGEEEFAIGVVGQAVSTSLAMRARTHAEEAASREAFLNEVSRVVGGSLHTREIAQKVADLIVPRLASAATIFMLNADETPKVIAISHAYPHCEHLFEVALIASDSGAEPAPIAERVVRSRESLLLPNLTPLMLQQLDLGDARRALVKATGVRTAIGIPLAVAGKMFGVMVLSDSRRQYGSNDLAFAERVGERVAAALENARLYAAAGEAIAARDEFMTLASHELRTPLASLQLHAEIMQRKARRAGDNEGASQADVIARQVSKLAALIEHIDEALRIRAEGVSLDVETCDLVPIVESSAKHVARTTRSPTQITLKTTDSMVGRWDRRRLEQLLCALLENAVKFGEGKPIVVELRRDAGDALLCVRDHGLGIAADQLSSVFLPFERAVPKENYGGLGLGLYIASVIAEAHGGVISVSSRVGDGTTFEVRLPGIAS